MYLDQVRDLEQFGVELYIFIVSHKIAMLMELVHNDKKAGLKTPIWEQYKSILQEVS